MKNTKQILNVKFKRSFDKSYNRQYIVVNNNILNKNLKRLQKTKSKTIKFVFILFCYESLLFKDAYKQNSLKKAQSY